MPDGWKKYLQYQKPMAVMLLALIFPTFAGVFCFGWRVLVAVLIGCATSFTCEYLFVRSQKKPVTMAALVTGALLTLTLPPNVPFWMIVIGCAFAIVFGKMVFGGFGKNIFNPALAGRCFLYITFPLAMTGSWYGPISGQYGGLTHWTSGEPVQEVELPPDVSPDGTTGATTLTATKAMSKLARKHYAIKKSGHDDEKTFNWAETNFKRARNAVETINIKKLFYGRVSGSMGETSALLILIALAYLLYRKAVQWPLVVAPLVGLLGTMTIFWWLELNVFPLELMLKINLFGGGTLFALTFMTTEPVSAPMHKRARWIYGILIGVLAVTIRSLSVFNAGFMFSILLGNMFAPIIEIACQRYDAWRKGS